MKSARIKSGKRAFDQRLGAEFLASVPVCPGVYRVFDDNGSLIYVGKAKNLRRRLAQYRNAKRRKKHRKMQKIVADAARIEFETCASDLEACLLEARLIRESRPRWNVAGAFSFMYPMIGYKRVGGETHFCFTTTAEAFAGFELHGAFRSREIVGEAFFALMELLKYVGHPQRPRAPRVRYSYVFVFRQIPEGWMQEWGRFLSGESLSAMESLVLALVDNAGARRRRRPVQKQLDALKRFWRHEAVPLAEARRLSGFASYPVPQGERDLIFLKRRYAGTDVGKGNEAPNAAPKAKRRPASRGQKGQRCEL